MWRNNIIPFYWKRKFNKSLIQLIKKCSVCLSIGPEMSEEYYDRYGTEFIPFQNPIKTEMWLQNAKKSWGIRSQASILYAGRIGEGISSSLIDIAIAVEELKKEGIDIRFEIQTASSQGEEYHKLAGYSSVVFNGLLNYEELPKKFSSVDVLLLPMDFDSSGLRFIRLSRPTKMPEYMATGTPILVYAPPQTAVSQYATKQRWGCVVNQRDKRELKRNIVKLISDESYRRKLGIKAQELAIKYHSEEIVRQSFQNILNSVPN
jgi:glycosyltransferase involved in cell wall biosynthesis